MRIHRFRKLTRKLKSFTVELVAIGLLSLGAIVAIVGFLNQHGNLYLGKTLGTVAQDFYANISAELVSIGITVLIVDKIYEARTEKQRKDQLIREMKSTDNGIALRAVEELRAHNWLTNGSLQRAWLMRANLQQANLCLANLKDVNLMEANLRAALLSSSNLERALLQDANLSFARITESNLEGTNLSGANLQAAALFGSNLSAADLSFTNLHGSTVVAKSADGFWILELDAEEEQALLDQLFVRVLSLRGATMPDGDIYDGRYNLRGDIRLARENGIDAHNPNAMAEWYGITLEDYQRGQQSVQDQLLQRLLLE